MYFISDTSGKPWCAVELDSSDGSILRHGKCFDERTIVYDGTDSNAGDFCQIPFLMNEK